MAAAASGRRPGHSIRAASSKGSRGERGKMLATFFALIGMLQSLYLLYREIFTLEAFCLWCLASLFVMTLLLPITVVRLLREPSVNSES